MTQRAKVGSIEAIEAFRSALIVYAAHARSALEEISGEVIRTRVWLENDQRAHWERELRRRGRVLEQAQAALFSARLSTFSDGISLEQIAVQRARRSIEEGNAKIRTLKKWTRDFEGSVQPLLKQVEKLHTILSHDLVKAGADLSEKLSTLANYAQTKPPADRPPTSPSPAPEDGPSAPKA